jgi:hypothetical protein
MTIINSNSALLFKCSFFAPAMTPKCQNSLEPEAATYKDIVEVLAMEVA